MEWVGKGGAPWGGGKGVKLTKIHPLMEVVVKNDENSKYHFFWSNYVATWWFQPKNQKRIRILAEKCQITAVVVVDGFWVSTIQLWMLIFFTRLGENIFGRFHLKEHKKNFQKLMNFSQIGQKMKSLWSVKVEQNSLSVSHCTYQIRGVPNHGYGLQVSWLKFRSGGIIRWSPWVS